VELELPGFIFLNILFRFAETVIVVPADFVALSVALTAALGMMIPERMKIKMAVIIRKRRKLCPFL